MNLIKIETNCIEVTWPYIKDFIQKPLDRSMGERNIEDIYYSLIHGQQQLWVAADEEDGMFGICITQILEYPNFKLCPCLSLVLSHIQLRNGLITE